MSYPRDFPSNRSKIGLASVSLQGDKSYALFGLGGFHGISTIVGYLMPNPIYTYILNIWLEYTFNR